MEKTTKLVDFKFSPKGICLIKEISIYISILILLSYGFTQSFIQYRILIFFAILLTTIGGIWFLAKKHSPTPLKPFLFLWLAAYSISIILSIDPRRSLSQMLIMLAGLFLFLLSHDLINRGWNLQWFMKSFVITGALVIAISFKDVITWYINWLSVNPGVFIPYINYRPSNANIFAPYMYLTFHMGLGLFIHEKKRLYRELLAIVILLSLIVLYLTSSRGAWLGTFFGMLIWGFYLFRTNETIIKAWFQKLVKIRWLMFISLTLVTLSLLLGGSLLYKKAIHPTHGGILTSRSGLWGPAITAFKQNPIFGQGQFTYGSAFLQENSSPPITIYGHAHGMYHNLLGEMGIVGFGAALVFGVAYLLKLKKVFIHTSEKTFLLAIIAYCLSYFVHNIFDSYHIEGSLIWPMAILTGAVIATPSLPLSKSTPKRPWWVLIYITLAWFGIWTVTPYYQAVELANQNQWQPAYETFQQAVKRDPGNALAHQQLALTAAVLAEQSDQAMLDIAITALETTIQYEPSWALNHANLSALYLVNDQPDQAVNSAQNAFKLAPRAPMYALNLGYILEQTGNETQAQSAYLQVLDLNPSWSSASYWEETPIRMMTQTLWLLEHPSTPATTLEEAEKVLQDNPQVSWAYNQLASVLLEQGQLDTARKTLENAGLAYVNSPVDGIETQWLWAEYYAKAGDHIKAIEIGKQAINYYKSYGVFGPGTFGSLQYAPNLFRLSAIALEIVPQVVDVPIPAIWLERAELLKTWEEQVQ